jgi:NAD+ synthase
VIRREDVPQRLLLDAPLAVRVLTGFIRDAIATTGKAGVVVGLSGGIDSALAAALAARGIGAERVHSFFLPYRTTSDDAATDAAAIAADLGLTPRTIEITPMVDAYFAIETDADQVRRGNKMARERMAILFDQAKKLDSLVLGTSNKTEILLGYSTIFGDNASSLNPLGDLYKQQVWQLSRHLGLLERVCAKPPSADLWPGQTDETDFGFSYQLADEVLYLIFDQGLTAEEVVERGYPEEVVRRVVRLEERNRFKRRLMLIARLSPHAAAGSRHPHRAAPGPRLVPPLRRGHGRALRPGGDRRRADDHLPRRDRHRRSARLPHPLAGLRTGPHRHGPAARRRLRRRLLPAAQAVGVGLPPHPHRHRPDQLLLHAGVDPAPHLLVQAPYPGLVRSLVGSFVVVVSLLWVCRGWRLAELTNGGVPGLPSPPSEACRRAGAGVSCGGH